MLERYASPHADRIVVSNPTGNDTKLSRGWITNGGRKCEYSNKKEKKTFYRFI
jgi:hypothetical protein